MKKTHCVCHGDRIKAQGEIPVHEVQHERPGQTFDYQRGQGKPILDMERLKVPHSYHRIVTM